MNNNLVGVVIDSGHGGTDSGAVGNNMYEKDYTLKISKYMYDRFKELGIPVIMTRDIDITLSPTERVEKILNTVWITAIPAALAAVPIKTKSIAAFNP